MNIPIKTAEEIDKMRVAGRLAAEVLEMLDEHVRAGATTGELNSIAHHHITEIQGCIPAPLDYHASPSPSAPRSTMWCVTASLMTTRS